MQPGQLLVEKQLPTALYIYKQLSTRTVYQVQSSGYFHAPLCKVHMDQQTKAQTILRALFFQTTGTVQSAENTQLETNCGDTATSFQFTVSDVFSFRSYSCCYVTLSFRTNMPDYLHVNILCDTSPYLNFAHLHHTVQQLAICSVCQGF